MYIIDTNFCYTVNHHWPVVTIVQQQQMSAVTSRCNQHDLYSAGTQVI